MGLLVAARGAEYVTRDTAEFDRPGVGRMGDHMRQIEAGWRHLPFDTEWVEFRGGAFPVASIDGVRNDEDNTFTPAGSNDRLPIWFKRAGSTLIYEVAPGPGHCGLPGDFGVQDEHLECSFCGSALTGGLDTYGSHHNPECSTCWFMPGRQKYREEIQNVLGEIGVLDDTYKDGDPQFDQAQKEIGRLQKLLTGYGYYEGS